MPTDFIDGEAQVEWHFRNAGVAQSMIFTCGFVVDFETASPQDVADDAYDALSSTWAAADINAGYSFLGTRMRGRNTVLVAAEKMLTVAGTRAIDVPPANVALLVHKNTGVAGRGNRGRMYLPPWMIDEAGIDEAGTITGADYTGNAAAIAGWYDTVTAEPSLGTPAVLHGPLIPATPITSFTLDSVVATQRRRLHRYGR